MAKSLKSNTFFNILYRVVNIAFPLITTIYVSRILLVESIGEVSFSQNIASYFVSLAILGLPNYGTKIIAKAKGNRDTLNKAFSELFLSNLITTGISSLFYVGIIVWSTTINSFHLYLSAGLLIIFNFLNVDWLYQGLEEYRYIAIRNIIVKAIVLILLFVFVRTEEDFIKYAYIASISTGFNYIFNIIHSRKFATLTLKNISLKAHLKVIAILGISVVCSTLYNKVDITMIGIMRTKSDVTYYSYAHNIITIFVNICTAMTAVFLPRLSYCYSEDKEKFFGLIKTGIHSVCLLSFPIIAGCILLAPEAIIILYGPDFEPAILAVRLFTIIIFVKSIGDLYCYQVAIASSREKQVTIAYLIGTIANVLLNIPLIFFYGIYGAVIASVVGEVVIDFSVFIGLKKEDRCKIPFSLMWKPLVSSLIMISIVLLPFFLIKNIFLKTAICVLTGIIVYTLFTTLLRDELVIGIERGFVQKIKSAFKRKKSN